MMWPGAEPQKAVYNETYFALSKNLINALSYINYEVMQQSVVHSCRSYIDIDFLILELVSMGSTPFWTCIRTYYLTNFVVKGFQTGRSTLEVRACGILVYSTNQ